VSRGVRLGWPQSLVRLAAELGGELDASARERMIESVVSPPDASSASDLVVVTSARFIDSARDALGVLLCSSELAPRVSGRPRWVHEQPMWVVARLLTPLVETGTARNEPELARDVEVGRGAVVHAGARVGAGSRIGDNAVVFAGVTIGERVVIGPLAVIGAPGFGWAAGPGGESLRIPQLGGVEIEDDAEIGALCTVDAGTLGPTRVGRGAKLDAHVHVAHNAQIGPGALVAAQSGFAGSAELGAGARVGGQVGVADHARIGARARVAAKSGVIGDVPAEAVVAGFPAVSRMRWLRAMARLLDRRRA
jgi:UDP-3-O-[3-hydroxymyristoyl] glucosamine N-acyltransferase